MNYNGTNNSKGMTTPSHQPPRRTNQLVLNSPTYATPSHRSSTSDGRLNHHASNYSNSSSAFTTPQPTHYFASSASASASNNLAPLVLDPNAVTQQVPSTLKKKSSASKTRSISSVGKLFARVSTPSSSSASSARPNTTPLHHPNKQQQQNQQQHRQSATVHNTMQSPNIAATSSSSNNNNDQNLSSGHQATSAVALSRTSPQAGYLSKLGVNIPEFKRRFFVLEQTTRLLYYMSPNDTAPRGSIPLSHGNNKIQALDSQPGDGRYRFALVLSASSSPSENTYDDDHDDDAVPNQQQIILEARSEEMAKKWMKVLQEEQIDYQKEKVETLQTKLQKRTQQIKEYQEQLATYVMIEQDRDGAIEDARNWKEKYGILEHAIHELISKLKGERKTNDESKEEDDHLFDDNDASDTPQTTPETDTSENDSVDLNPTSSQLDVTLQTTSIKIKGDAGSNDAMTHLPAESSFPALSTLCQELQTTTIKASGKAETALADLEEANKNLSAVEKRMQKAEKHILKLWEENCTLRTEGKNIRKTLKQKKREKRVLVRELKTIQAASIQMAEEEEETAKKRRNHLNQNNHRGKAARSQTSNTQETEYADSDQERLINELEEHVNSSIQLNEQLLSSGGRRNYPRPGRPVINGNNINRNNALGSLFHHDPSEGDFGRVDSSIPDFAPIKSGPLLSPLRPKVLSLLDEQSSESEDDDEEEEVDDGIDDGIDDAISLSAMSSVVAEMGDVSSVAASLDQPTISAATSDIDQKELVYTYMPPFDEPEKIYDDGNSDSELSNLTALTSVVTSNGQATSRLACPLADIVETYDDSRESVPPDEHDWGVYRLEFYSQKIGIQFCKVPPPSNRVKSRGLLTDALKADMHGYESMSESGVNGPRSAHGSINDTCPVAMPADYVLVCGFEGFSETESNPRPKLGARLVAFDDISVETGPWAFDSIRKAIKSRSRPLTLSFRNDPLTPDQRSILTKALSDVDVHLIKPRSNAASARNPFPQQETSSRYHDQYKPFASSSESVYSYGSSRADHDMGGGMDRLQEGDAPILDLSSELIDSGNCSRWRKRLGSSSSQGSAPANVMRRPNFQSFSETGSSVISTSLAPLMANLMKGVSDRVKQNEKAAPGYLNRRDLLQNDPQHRNFQSSLL